jgi:hypothetical protein
LIRLGVRRQSGCPAFLSAGSLPSLDSADASAAPLFAEFAGTTDPSDFPAACTSALPSETFADRSQSKVNWEAEGISRFSRLKFPDLLRVFDSAVPPVRSP